MGVLDALGEANQDFKHAVETGPGPVPVGLGDAQNAVQGAIGATTGMGEDEFAVASAQVADQAGEVISTPGEKFGEATEGTPIDNPASQAAKGAGETVWDWWVKWPARVAYGTATGADLRGEDPQQATGGGYTPGILESLELIPAAKVANSSRKLATKGGKAMLKSDNTLTKGSRAADDTVETQVQTTVRNQESRLPERLKKPDHLADGGSGSVKEELLKFYPQSRLTKGALAGTAGFGALGLTGSLPFPTNYEKAEKLSPFPGATIVEEKNNDGNPLGYWVVLNTAGGEHTILTTGQGTTTVEFPTERDPTFDSAEQARNAFTRYSQAVQDGRRELPAVLQDQDRPADRRTWHQTKRVAMLDDSWYLVEQKKRGEQKYRYAVAGTTSDNSIIYIHPGGESRSSPNTYPDKETAMEMYRKWAEDQAGPAPDPKTERPSESALTGDLSTPTGSLGTIGTAAVGIGAGLGLLLLLKVVL